MKNVISKRIESSNRTEEPTDEQASGFWNVWGGQCSPFSTQHHSPQADQHFCLPVPLLWRAQESWLLAFHFHVAEILMYWCYTLSLNVKLVWSIWDFSLYRVLSWIFETLSSTIFLSLSRRAMSFENCLFKIFYTAVRLQTNKLQFFFKLHLMLFFALKSNKRKQWLGALYFSHHVKQTDIPPSSIMWKLDSPQKSPQDTPHLVVFWSASKHNGIKIIVQCLRSCPDELAESPRKKY